MSKQVGRGTPPREKTSERLSGPREGGLQPLTPSARRTKFSPDPRPPSWGDPPPRPPERRDRSEGLLLQRWSPRGHCGDKWPKGQRLRGSERAQGRSGPPDGEGGPSR